jgi:hypothetical protein
MTDPIYGDYRGLVEPSAPFGARPDCAPTLNA